MKKKYDILLLIPSILGILIFFIIPFFRVFLYAITENSFTNRFVGFQNFINVLNNEYFQLAFKNTFLFTMIAGLTTMLFSMIIAFLLAHLSDKSKRLQKVFYLPFFLPSVTIVTLWQAYFNEYTPFTSLLFIFIWKYSGLNIMLILSALASIDKDMVDASKIDGASSVRSVLSVILPNIAPTLFLTGILTFVNSFKIYRESYLLWGAYPDESVYMLQNYLDNHFSKMNYQYISSAAIIFIVCIYLIIAGLFIMEKKWSDEIL